jgi:rod shape-determining protein MreC
VIVNRGDKHLVQMGEAVVDATGVIGQVTRTYPLSSEVTLITDKSLAIPIQVERNGLRAIAFGHGRDNTLDLPYLPTNVDVKKGDKLVTSGIDGIYPAGLAVATVSHIEITPDSPFARIICVPTGGVEHHRQVLLVSIPEPEILPKALSQDDKLTVPRVNKSSVTNQQTAPKKPAQSTPSQPQTLAPAQNPVSKPNAQ